MAWLVEEGRRGCSSHGGPSLPSLLFDDSTQLSPSSASSRMELKSMDQYLEDATSHLRLGTNHLCSRGVDAAGAHTQPGFFEKAAAFVD